MAYGFCKLGAKQEHALTFLKSRKNYLQSWFPVLFDVSRLFRKSMVISFFRPQLYLHHSLRSEAFRRERWPEMGGPGPPGRIDLRGDQTTYSKATRGGAVPIIARCGHHHYCGTSGSHPFNMHQFVLGSASNTSPSGVFGQYWEIKRGLQASKHLAHQKVTSKPQHASVCTLRQQSAFWPDINSQ